MADTDHSMPRHLRVVVEERDDRYARCTDEATGRSLRMLYDTCYQGLPGCSWTYLRPMLEPGARLSIVEPRMEADGTVVPELIVYLPDYLVNISEVAACFQAYGINPDIHIINRLKADPVTEAILLGNFASQLLDEEIACGGLDYNESVRRFFRRNAISMLATDISRDFHDAARRQRANIHGAFSGLQRVVGEYDRSQVVLEPSFFSPMLGLQGRMDLLQLDHRLLVEQKSGKASWPEPAEGEAPRQQQGHYVQMLLYMAILRYNYPETYARNGGVASFLLYSRYSAGLCALGGHPELLFQAMRVRNCIVHSDYANAADGYAMLDTLTPDSIRAGAPVSHKLWHNYILPQLSSVLDPIQRATPLERLYFHAMMRFTACEHLLAKTGTGSPEDAGLAGVWLSTTEQKLQAGNIYTELTLGEVQSSKYKVQCADRDGEPAASQSEITEVTLTFSDPEVASTQNFRRSDAVILYPYPPGREPDAGNVMVIRGGISEITASSVTIRLRAPQSDARVFTRYSGSLWAVEHDFMEASVTAQYRGVHAFLTATDRRRSLLLMQRPPEIGPETPLRGDYGQFAELQRRVKRARDMFLIIGPPGTGKTSYGMLYTLQEALADPDACVLLTAYTNRAVDEMCGKLAEQGIDYVRLGSSMAADPRCHSHMLERKVDACGSLEALRRLVLGAHVVAATTTTLCGNPAIFTLKSFDLAIIDEASQILEPQLLPILSARHGARDAVRKFVMIGDHKQLPAVVRQHPGMSAVSEPRLHEIGLTDCRLSLFERMLRRYADDPDVTYMLTRQGRMHRDIAEFANQAFYGGRLDVVPLPHQCAELTLGEVKDSKFEVQSSKFEVRDWVGGHRQAFIAVRPADADLPADKVNLAEARVIASLVHGAYLLAEESGGFDPDTDVGVIVPYRNQISAVRRAIERLGIPALTGISIDTVERYQGSQRECIIYGTTVSNPAQLAFLTANTFEEEGCVIDRKLNVALTRARRHLFVVGNPDILRADDLYHRLMEFMHQRGAYYDSPAGLDCSPTIGL